jgi:hypothetical protein
MEKFNPREAKSNGKSQTMTTWWFAAQIRFHAQPLPRRMSLPSSDDLQLTSAGYYQADQKPPIAAPPPSQEWVKTNPIRL